MAIVYQVFPKGSDYIHPMKTLKLKDGHKTQLSFTDSIIGRLLGSLINHVLCV